MASKPYSLGAHIIDQAFEVVMEKYEHMNGACKKVVGLLRTDDELLDNISPRQLSQGFHILCNLKDQPDLSFEKSLVLAFGDETGKILNERMIQPKQDGLKLNALGQIEKMRTENGLASDNDKKPKP